MHNNQPKEVVNPIIRPLKLMENPQLNAFNKPQLELANSKSDTVLNTLLTDKNPKQLEAKKTLLDCKLDKQNKKRYQLICANSPKYIQQNRRVSLTKIISLMCPQCGLSFENRCKLTRHLMDHKMASNPYRCHFTNCLQSYDSRIK